MSGPTVLSIDEGAVPAPGRPAFYFDFHPVLARSHSLSSHPERARLMCEHCVRRLAPHDIMVPQEGGFFLIVLSAAGSAAEALAHEINIALLELFFGTDALSQNLGTICRKATIAEIEAKGIAIPPAPCKPAHNSALERVEADPLARLAQGGLSGYHGLSTGFAPLINLNRETSPLYLCGAVRTHKGRTLFGAEALGGIDARDRASLDEAMLEYGLARTRAMAPTRSATAIMTPVHYETLAWSRGRQLYQKALRAAGAADNPFLLVKIEGLPRGTTATRLTEIVSMVRPHVRRVFLELSECDHNLLRGGHLGVAGFIGALPGDASLHAAGRQMSNLVQFAASQQAVACIANIAGPNQMALARASGARFAIHSTAGGVIQTALAHDEHHAAGSGGLKKAA